MFLSEEQVSILNKRIISVLKLIYDPEIHINIYELGLIYDIKISDKADVKIVMTLTTPNCPIAESFPEKVKNKIKTIDLVRNVEITLTFDPPWNTDMLSEAARLDLGML